MAGWRRRHLPATFEGRAAAGLLRSRSASAFIFVRSCGSARHRSSIETAHGFLQRRRSDVYVKTALLITEPNWLASWTGLWHVSMSKACMAQQATQCKKCNV
jgi:hypothetical protein